jgi:2-polyprenyl-6-methoxyphenol hydroxylase-like FAD-dependent oxidoreductase
MRAVIVGGGIAGPVLGMFLRRVGVEAVICEARGAEALNEGAYLGLAPNGMNVLAALGLADAIAALGRVSEAFSFFNARGRPIGDIDQRKDVAQYGQPMVMIKRSVLNGALLDAARRDGVEVCAAARVAHIACDDSRVEVVCEDGRRVRGDFVVGADGVGSRTRELLFADASRPLYTGILDCAGFTRVLPDDPLMSSVNTMVFGKRAFFGAYVTPEGELWWFHNGGSPEPLRDLDPEAARARLLEQHADDPPWIGAAIARTERVLGPWPQYVMPELARWHSERACLIGDAAHATSPSGGQGASLALEDAMALARALRDAREPAQAFAAFERARKPRVAEVVAQSMRNSRGKVNAGPVAAWLRDHMLATFLKLGARAQVRAYAHRIPWP